MILTWIVTSIQERDHSELEWGRCYNHESRMVPAATRDRIANRTKNNPKMRDFALLNEDVSLAKTCTLSEAKRTTADLRFEPSTF